MVGFSGHLLSIVNFLLTLVFVSFILRSKRPPGSTMAWLLFVAIIPYLGIPLYIFFSDRKFKTRLDRKNALYIPNASASKDLEEDAVEKILMSLGAPPERMNEKAQLFATGEGAYGAIADLIQSAQREIYITTFIFGDDPVGRAIVALLEVKARQGVDVRVLLDSVGAMWVKHPSFKQLEKEGGHVSYFMKMIHSPFKGRTNLRNHRKLLVVDGESAIVGGMNLAQEYLGPMADPERWIDLCFLLTGPSVNDVRDIFVEDWNFSTGERLRRFKNHDGVHARSNDKEAIHDLQVVASGPDVKGDPLYDAILTLIYRAVNRIWIATPYFIPDDSLIKALELAARRGVDVRILTPKKSNHFLADLARGTYLSQLLKVGGKIKLTHKMLHAKALVVDNDCALVGSANFDMRSLLLNYEVGVFVWSAPTFKSLEAWYEQAYTQSEACVVTAGYWSDLTQGLGRVVGPLI